MTHADNPKPVVRLIGVDSNIFVLVGVTSRELRRVGQNEEANKMIEEVWASKNYNEALQIIMNFVEVE